MTEETLFAAALDRADPAERSAFLNAHCPDPEARRRVEELLAAHAAAGSFLNHPAVGADATATLPPTDPDSTQTRAGHEPGGAATGHAGGRAADPTEVLAFLSPPTRPGSLGRLAHYEVHEVLGVGGFGTVLKAFDDRLHRVVAVKVLAPQLAASGAARARFLREARTAAAVRDEHVVNVFAVSDDDAPVPFLVMELVAGQTLQQKLDKAGPLPPKEVLRIGAQIARGLAAAHRQGLIHRDIKPANILLENGVERVKVTDFGLARAADDASISQSGVVAGTPMYMSPEQARGDTLDTRSDLFSLGSVLYVLCTGRPPFRAENTLAVLKRVVEDDPRPVRDVNPEVPRWLADVVAKLHAKIPADRFQTAEEVADLLSGYLSELQQQGTVVSRVAPKPAPPLRPAKKRRRWPWVAAGCLLLVLLTPVLLVLLGIGLPAVQKLMNDDRGEVIVVRAAGLESVRALRDGDSPGDWQDVSNGQTLRLPPGHYTLEPRFAAGLTTKQWDVTATQGRFGGGSVSIGSTQVSRSARFEVVPGGRVTARVEVTRTSPGSAPPPPAVAPFDPAMAELQQKGWAAHLGVPVEFTHPSGVAFRLIPPGEFGMGYTDVELAAVRSSLKSLPNVGDYQRFAAESSGPRHTVRITRPFYLAKYETTAGQFRRFVEAAKHAPTGTIDWTGFVTPGQEDRQPVVGVSWADAEAFCRWLGPGYELPTEAQWEYAARGGAPGIWSFGNVPTKLLDHAVFGQAWPKPGPVGLKAPNPFGLFDVHGGADEWCRDWHVADFYRRSPIDDPANLDPPTQPNTGRASRGGSWNAAAVYTEVAFRSFDNPTRPALPKGFRVALTGDLKAAVGAATGAGGAWVSLFNGKDLTGWKTVPGSPANWTVVDGVLTGRGPVQNYLYSARGDYRDFHLRAECRVNDLGNSGVHFRVTVPTAEVMGAPPGYEVQVAGPAADQNATGSLMIFPAHEYMLARVTTPPVPANVWFTLEVIARGRRVVVRVNDKVLVDHEHAGPEVGHLALQAFPGTTAEFRKVEVKELTPEPAAPPPDVPPVSAAEAKAHQEAWAARLGVKVEFENSVGMKMRLIPPGEFTAGTTDAERAQVLADLRAGSAPQFVLDEVAAEPPPARVRVSDPFYAAAHEVTVGQFRRFVAATGYQTDGEKAKDGGWAHRDGRWQRHPAHQWRTPGNWTPGDDEPVTQVSWNDARAFCAWLGKEDGRAYALPTGVQWEYAARAGSAGRHGAADGVAALDAAAWFAGNLPAARPERPQPVGGKQANPFGLYDTLGNVWEWCADASPLRPGGRVTRGGGWNSGPASARVNIRGAGEPDRAWDAGTGFRVVVTGDLRAPVAPPAVAPPPGTLVLPLPEPWSAAVYAAIIQARRERVAAAEKGLAAAKARFDAGLNTRREVAEAEIGVFEAQLDGAPAAGAVRLLEQIVERHETRRAVAAARVEAGVLTPDALNPIDADIARARSRLADARLAVPQSRKD
ncbi:SUMF1/EgtB/PvdO family nonheme iron enzyme [Urbifossiella limnaea]|uniref:non-specific serine/threonine protein kinase n=1 Tax=Urbifossiella limnaea TaxID=2528023 RepID=A0A517XZ80_9BACT|nr:SUMF1/EgtB/PvdO family nonheme iron enzyme [Urbifossiella limnaea]QDU22819.1 Serine/threonine-protein kinase PknB [Urbifossiella limnaea]